MLLSQDPDVGDAQAWLDMFDTVLKHDVGACVDIVVGARKVDARGSFPESRWAMGGSASGWNALKHGDP
jgi:hypothetical protein